MKAYDDRLVVVLAALDVEYRAVRAHVTDIEVWQHPSGTVFEIGTIAGTRRRIAMAVTGKGNVQAGVITSHSAEFRPVAVVFVGIAGALRDSIALGDFVVATRVYAYHGGSQEDDEFSVRPRAWDAAFRLIQLAQHVARTDWRTDLKVELTGAQPPRVHFEAIAAGEVVLNSRRADLAVFLRRNYNDAVAVSMEDAGVAQAAHIGNVDVIVVRGISDLADGTKLETDAAWQPIAAANAAAFAIALIKAHVATRLDERGAGRWPNRERELAQLEEEAQQLLDDPAGPAERYRAAIDFDRQIAASALDPALATATAQPLAPLPSGTAAAVCAGLERLLENAADRIDTVIGRAAVAATQRRREADHQVGAFEAPLQPPHLRAASPPAPPTYDLQFRNQTLLALVSVVLAAILTYVGSTSYTGRDTSADQVRAVLWLVVALIGVVQVVRWFRALPRGLIAIRDNARTRRDYQRRTGDYERQNAHQEQADAAYQQAERRRSQSLEAARAARVREERVAAELSTIVHQGQRIVAALRDPVVTDQVRELTIRYHELQQS